MLPGIKNKHISLHQLEDISYLLLGAWDRELAKSMSEYDAIIITTTSRETFEDLVRKVVIAGFFALV